MISIRFVLLVLFWLHSLLCSAAASWIQHHQFAVVSSRPIPYSCHKSLANALETSRLSTHQRRLRILSIAHSSKEEKSVSTNTIYSMPAMYDIAFGYRGFEQEVEFLFDHLPSSTLRDAQRSFHILELAAGPARHSITALQIAHEVLPSTCSLGSVTCLDLSKDMKEYALETADMELATDDRERFHYVQGDMTSFDLSKTFDSVWILLGSLQHLTTNEEVFQCFQCAYRHLKDDGTLIIELPHPMETFSMIDCTRNGWEVPLDDDSNDSFGTLKIIWGDDTDTFDPITQVRQFTVAMELDGVEETSTNADIRSIRQIVPMRLFTAQEIDALAMAAGFKVDHMYGALDKDVDVKDEDIAFRMVTVLRKRNT